MQKWGRGNIFKPRIGNFSVRVQQDTNDNGVRVVNFAKSKKNLVVKSTMFPHRNIR